MKSAPMTSSVIATVANMRSAGGGASLIRHGMDAMEESMGLRSVARSSRCAGVFRQRPAMLVGRCLRPPAASIRVGCSAQIQRECRECRELRNAYVNGAK
jgi:hypothetical protein